MRALSNSDMLQLWERGQTLHPIDQGLFALALSDPGSSLESTLDAVADLSLGARNRALAELRNLNFGPRINGRVACPRCSENLEFELDCMDLISGSGDTVASVEIEGNSYRLPTSRDVALAVRQQDLDAASRTLVERCALTDSTRDISDEQIDRIGEQMAAADPLAEPRLSFQCALCNYAWDELLDLASFLWAEVDARVRRLLVEVHTLASAYGWSESQILALSAHRRALYLEIVRA